MKTKTEKPKLNYIGKKLKKLDGNFTQLPNEILFGLGKYSELKAMDVRVYAILLKEIKFRNDVNKQVDSDGDAFCYMTQDQLAEKANVGSRKTVSKYVKHLEQMGLVYAKWNGIKKCYAYYVALPDKVENDEKSLVDANEIGKKLTEEQKEKKKAAREKKREDKAQEKELNNFVNGIQETEMPDFN